VAPVLSEARKRRIDAVLRRRLASVTVVLENLHDPHNGAAVVRTCEAFGLVHLHAIEGTEPFPLSRRVSRNAHRWINVHLHPTVESCLGGLAAAGFHCLATVPPPLGRRRVSGLEVSCDRPLAIVFGSEHDGLSSRARALCDGEISIPLHGFCESLNLSVSVAVCLAPLVEARRELLGRPGDLPARQRDHLRAAYYATSTPHAADLVLRELRRASGQ
jgi:tRNA (guanosine-2'-O-)-methyltransferase